VPISIDEAEQIVRSHLKSTGRRLHFGTRDKITLQALWTTTQLVSIIDLLYAAKRLDPLVSRNTVEKFLQTACDCRVAEFVEEMDRGVKPNDIGRS
jgi:predicted alpha/beta-hydrolase family hydrolase